MYMISVEAVWIWSNAMLKMMTNDRNREPTDSQFRHSSPSM